MTNATHGRKLVEAENGSMTVESHELPVKLLHEGLVLFRKIEAVVNKFRGKYCMAFTSFRI